MAWFFFAGLNFVCFFIAQIFCPLSVCGCSFESLMFRPVSIDINFILRIKAHYGDEDDFIIIGLDFNQTFEYFFFEFK